MAQVLVVAVCELLSHIIETRMLLSIITSHAVVTSCS